MATSDWQKVKLVLADALEEPPEQRTAFVERSCNGDTTLLREVNELLAQDTIVLEQFAVERRDARETTVIETGRRIGGYEIAGEIGRGGMGAVYLARRADGVFEREVAVKLLKRGTDTDEVLRRFGDERRILARLEHPNVARLLDAGATDDGLPFFVMEYVQGEPITAYARQRHLSMRDRLALFLKVCSAVQAAHDKHVIHRDLKPSNILVRPDGEPKLLDFGIAKLLDAPDDAVLVTVTEQRRLTPSCASPEQARGQAVTPATDVYALGVLLYELLTGKSPHPFSSPHPTTEEITHVVCEVEPVRPSLAVETAERRRALRGDLDTIALTAFRKEPERRYGSVAALAEDIQRHLTGRPILARKNSVGYVTFRFFRRNGTRVAAAAILAAIGLAGGYFVFRPHERSAAPPVSDKSIAVLPFQNVGNNNETAYFAQGVADEIVTRVSKLAELKVISRTSTQSYLSAPDNLPLIGRELGVAYLVEGSVQKNGDSVRLNVQLFNAADNSQVWANSFESKGAAIFSVEGEIATSIARHLHANPTKPEKDLIAAKPTDNPEAYDAYLRGLAYSLRTANSPANSLAAQKYFKEAVRLDPKFALGWAALSETDSRGYITSSLQVTAALREEARQAADTALALQPELGEALLAKGHYYYSCLKDYDSAVLYFEQARRFMPNNSRVPESLAAATRRQGKWKQSYSYFEQAERLDPRNTYLLTQHARSDIMLRKFPDAVRKLNQVLDITPDDQNTIKELAVVAQAEGDLPRASALLIRVHPNANDFRAVKTQVNQAILEHRPAQVIPRLQEILAKSDPALGYINGELRFWLGWAQELAGDHGAAQQTFQHARTELEAFLKEQPEHSVLLGDLALTCMGLGDKTGALQFAERAMAVNPIEKDPINGPDVLEVYARVAARMGESDRAFGALEKLLALPYNGGPASQVPLTPALLRLDPMFDPLRGDERFQQLLERTQDRNGDGAASSAENANAPTKDLVAYDLFLRGQALMDDIATSTDWEGDNRRAIDLFERAVTHDPTFALAYARLCGAHLNLYGWVDTSEARLAQANQALAQAERLAPTSPDTYIAEGSFAAEINDDKRAYERFGLAHRARPDDPLILSDLAEAEDRLGMWDQAIRDLEKAKQLGPRISNIPNRLKAKYAARRDYRASDRICDQAIADFPNGPSYYRLQKVQNAVARGATQQARDRLAEIPAKFDASGVRSLYALAITYAERDYDRFKREFTEMPWDRCIEQIKAEAQMVRAVVADQESDHATVEALLLSMRDKVAGMNDNKSQTSLGPRVTSLAMLARIDSYLGRTDEALREIEEAVRRVSTPVGKPTQELIRAEVLMRAGRLDEAVEILDRIARVPYGPSYGELLTARWDRLRKEPRFQEIVDELRRRLN